MAQNANVKAPTAIHAVMGLSYRTAPVTTGAAKNGSSANVMTGLEMLRGSRAKQYPTFGRSFSADAFGLAGKSPCPLGRDKT